MAKYIPNTITLIASLFGALAVLFALEGNLNWAGYAILFAAFLDLIDGMLARLLGVSSKLGADLDSLNDVISFGMAPTAVAYQLLHTLLPTEQKHWAYAALFIVPFSVLRLAIFNNATNQKTSFVGLPVPAHALLWVGLIFLKDNAFSGNHIIYNSWALLATIIVFSLLLVSKLHLFSFKFEKNKNPLTSSILLLFLLVSGFFLYFFHLGGLYFIILMYVSLGLFQMIRKSF